MSDNAVANDQRFETGALVRALNGGPMMVVAGPDPERPGFVLTTWFDRAFLVREFHFPESCLARIERPVDPSTQ
jgi:uncharacterized protein YodC (DUF2158 family)